MRSLFRHIFLVFVLCIAGCAGGGATFNAGSFSELLYRPQYAAGFEILSTAEGDARLIVVKNPWQGAEGVEQMLLIDPAQRFDIGQHPTVQRITAPAERIVCLSSSHIAMLDAIGQVERVVGVSGINFIMNEHIVANRAKIGDIGYDNNMNYELLLSLDADLVLLYGVSAENSIENKLRELGIPYFYIGEYVESSPLGKAEWIVAVGEATDHRKQGEECFNLIAESYNALTERIAEHITDEERPRAMINTPYRDAWVLPSENNYMARIISDAGGRCYTTEGEGNTSKPIDIEQALLYAESADFWLNVGSCHTLQELTSQNPRFANVKVVEERKVYNNTARSTAPVGSDFWESGVVRPDLILKDLATIFHPEIMGEEHTLYYYTRLN